MAPPPTTEALTPERILAATEDVLRRHGAAKATVVDVARALGVSHGSVYRHFRTKAELRGAVTKRWLDRTTALLDDVVAGDEAPPAKLGHWLTALFEAKRHKAGDDPELFATYTVLTAENSDVVDAHIAELVGHLTAIVRQGVDQGAFEAADAAVTARAIFEATAHFHDPGYAPQWSRPGAQQAFEAVTALVLRGIEARQGAAPGPTGRVATVVDNSCPRRQP
ncbi:TetR family transcriptional regulator [Streptomyces sp. VRA16 Mangrove soil]|uniref:TetR family transcriptional regulator n=1 Tax=Streptomyces sp. VRA16 Mangrove soil TaxID=2817434 RepID=UPI001A9F5CA8|nr:TetR family transcriptional regulator [Streptomyces sp. VRA16 Mangrove soil]MBO1336912.1 TetR family transcriptional regulator [Streptomyces sp. VRA16 Mangrove soil]